MIAANQNYDSETGILQRKIEEIVSKACAKHPKESSEFIHLSQSASDPRICMVCISEQKIPNQDTLSIRQVLRASKDSFLTNYPVISVDPQLQQTMNSYVNSVGLITTQIEEFFNSLKQTLELFIEKAKQASKSSLIQLRNLFDLTNSSLQEISQTEELKRILQENDQQNKKLAGFVKNHCKNSQKNTAIVNQNYLNFREQFKSFSLEQPYQVKEQIYILLSDLSLFSGSSSSFLLNSTNNNPQQFGIKNSIYRQEQFRKTDGFNKNRQPIFNIQKVLNNRQYCSVSQPWLVKETIQKEEQESVISSVRIIPSQKISNSVHQLKVDRRKNRQLHLTLIGSEFNWVQGYFSQQLLPATKYIIRVQFLWNSQKQPSFSLGLISNSKKDHELITKQGMCYSEWSITNGVNKVVRGSQLNHQDDFSLKRMEVRLHLAERYFAVSDFPNYQNIVELDDSTKIKPDENYYFGFNFSQKENSIIFEDVIKVDKFDDKLQYL